jgi:hypothetical protein
VGGPITAELSPQEWVARSRAFAWGRASKPVGFAQFPQFPQVLRPASATPPQPQSALTGGAKLRINRKVPTFQPTKHGRGILLRIKRPTVVCQPTEHIADMIDIAHSPAAGVGLCYPRTCRDRRRVSAWARPSGRAEPPSGCNALARSLPELGPPGLAGFAHFPQFPQALPPTATSPARRGRRWRADPASAVAD